jgi:hypothetical protein
MATPRDPEARAKAKEEWDRRLDEMLEETFPASDAPATHTGGGREEPFPQED